jgi:solute carrier family 27 fatty acid transporter 1/4
MSSNEIIYNTLPLYHTAGGMLGVGNILLFGSTMVLRKKFSASNFWTDCVKFNCTVAQYIGELCRFLLLTPKKPEESTHNVRMMFGNGLRPQIWNEFQSRFNIKEIGELYGATESNANLANMDNTPGAIGFVPQFAKPIYPVELIKCDEETGEPIRNEEGFCMCCEYGEPGVFIGKIGSKDPARAFSGYSDKKASEKKVLSDVFKSGDKYFNSGDILVMDVYGYFYFKDRTGDTFR